MDWNDVRPLTTADGEALAREVVDAGEMGSDVVHRAIESLSYLDCEAADAGPDGLEALRRVYLRGLAAVAIVADVAAGARRYTSAQEFAVNGREAQFLPLGVTLGTMTAASSSMAQVTFAVSRLRLEGEDVKDHYAMTAELRSSLTQLTLARLRGARG